MPAPASVAEFVEIASRSGVVDRKELDVYLENLSGAGNVPQNPVKLARYLIRDGLLTLFQADQFLRGKWKGFMICGKYKLLDRLGSGGVSNVFLCEHKIMRKRVAVKVLPAASAQDPTMLERFYREARAGAALDHPNICRALDIDRDGNFHVLVMEYVDGCSLQEIIVRHGPMDLTRACHYITQGALGLQYAHECGLVHRDIKPGNLLLDRSGAIKILDMGLVLFFHSTDAPLTKQEGNTNVLGTADFLAPEQALDSHAVDIRADIYSLGVTFYFLLTGKLPFEEGTITQKLIWHQTRPPRPIRDLRPEVPEEMTAVVEKMLAKKPEDRYQTPGEIAEALAAWTNEEIAPPPEAEMPQMSPAARRPELVGPASSARLAGPASSPGRAKGPPSSFRMRPARSVASPVGMDTPRGSATGEGITSEKPRMRPKSEPVIADEEATAAAPLPAVRKHFLLWWGALIGGVLLGAGATALVTWFFLK